MKRRVRRSNTSSRVQAEVSIDLAVAVDEVLRSLHHMTDLELDLLSQAWDYAIAHAAEDQAPLVRTCTALRALTSTLRQQRETCYSGGI